MTRGWTQLGASLLAVISCSLGLANAAVPPVTEGTVNFADPSSNVKGQTWYRIHGDLRNSRYPPLVVLHGGPGLPTDYLFPLKALGDDGRAVVFYDQIGSGRSTRFPKPNLAAGQKADYSFLTEELFRNELTNLLTSLGINDRPYDLIGHSWGGMLGSAFASYRPKNLRRLVLYSSPASMDLWIKANNQLLAGLPQGIQETIMRNERAGTIEDNGYRMALEVYYNKHLCRVPYPDELQKSAAGLLSDNTVHSAMIGPAEFTITGSLRTWSVIDRLPKIQAPTLIINGAYDQAQDSVIKPFRQHIWVHQWVKMKESSHMAHFEEPQAFKEAVGNFLGRRHVTPMKRLTSD
ncbi:MAG: hypothetical protein M1823_000361 [Watsoniomyces obsoletus]|nr:MAG: hypothetical protein M1823_000361 [Watsoniomyces obsoletus]